MDPTAGVALRWTLPACRRPWRWSGTVAHVSAGGIRPDPTGFAAHFALCLAVVASLRGRPAPTLGVVVLVTAGQTFVHGTLTALSGHPGDPPLPRVVAAPTCAPLRSWVPGSTSSTSRRRPGSGAARLRLRGAPTACSRACSRAANTVGNQVTHIFAKLRVASHAEAIICARDAGLGG